jgi:hypothetical protein
VAEDWPVRKKPPLEAKVEADFMKEVKRLGLPVKIRKMNGLGYVSWPDRLIIGPKGFCRWIEFKRPEIGKLSPGQIYLFAELAAWGHHVSVFTDGKLAAQYIVGELEPYR